MLIYLFSVVPAVICAIIISVLKNKRYNRYLTKYDEVNSNLDKLISYDWKDIELFSEVEVLKENIRQKIADTNNHINKINNEYKRSSYYKDIKNYSSIRLKPYNDSSQLDYSYSDYRTISTKKILVY